MQPLVVGFVMSGKAPRADQGSDYTLSGPLRRNYHPRRRFVRYGGPPCHHGSRLRKNRERDHDADLKSELQTHENWQKGYG